MKRWTITAKFEPRDIWVGVFWDRDPSGLHIFVCLVPMLVIHVAKVRRCHVCGCTDDAACWPSCWWVDTNLCSECVA